MVLASFIVQVSVVVAGLSSFASPNKSGFLACCLVLVVLVGSLELNRSLVLVRFDKEE